ncbi:unnamed protein product [Adineta ricciae]|uniref:Metalloreductase STEAP4 n=1 Tax=Adineta ricciae TaxID=249248 RepID=A0A815MKX1_ADIRI|nr:unnamed protein product [Adineta ricciae]CAF1417734.1 unnamed protein product [Adineta ricciae]
MNNDQCIGVVGSGNMGLAIAYRLFLNGFRVVLGSRFPSRRQGTKYEVGTIVECIRRSSIIFVAVHPENYQDCLVSCLNSEPSLFNGKILIDLSNQTSAKTHQQNDLSNAEQLQQAIPNAFVVKAFNTVSSFVMQSETAGEPHNILVASDHSVAKDKVIALAREMNFESFNAGSLRAARRLENDTKALFPHWRIPILFALFVLCIWLTYILCMYYINYGESTWDQLFLTMINKALGPCVITMLAIVYMPSNLACMFQLAYGTRERRFPAWLDRWMLSRKYLGLLTFALALCHALFTIILLSPAYIPSWFQSSEIRIMDAHNRTRRIFSNNLMSGTGEIAALLGVLTVLSMSVLAITSIPAIGNLLNWREWRFIQSKLGTTTLLLAIGHVIAVGIPFWFPLNAVKAFSNLSSLCLYLPVLTILLKFIFWLPCFSRPLYRIRRGQDTRQSNKSKILLKTTSF